MKKYLALATIIASLAACSKNDKQAKNYTVNESTSRVEWKGSAPDHFHVGSFDVNGSLSTNSNGVVNGGNFVIPIASIEDFDLQDPVKQVLLDDLKSDHFFDIVLHPNAAFKISNVVPYSGTDASAITGANYLVTGDFSLIGQTHQISFPAKITLSKDSLITQAKLNIDRTKWGMNIYSDPNAQLYILPEVNLQLNIRAATNQK